MRTVIFILAALVTVVAAAPGPAEEVRLLSDPASVTDETLDIQVDLVRRTRFDSRKVSAGGTLLGDLGLLKR